MSFHLVPVSRDKWLENPRPRARKRRSSSGKKRRPPKGFRTWRAYMDSIRPNRKGGTVAKRRRRRRRTAAINRPRRRRRRRINPPVALTNRRRRRRRRINRPLALTNRRRRRHHSSRRRINPPRFSVRGIIGQAKTAAVTGVQIVGGKIATRVVRNYIPGGKPAPGAALTPTQIAIELGAATVVGYLGSMFLGARVGANLMAGGFVGVIESLVKTYKVPVAADALGDDGDPNVITVPAHMSGYVRDTLAGYVQDGADVNGPGLGAYGPANSAGVIADDSGVFADIGIG